MNTVSKGNSLENETFNLLKRELELGKLGIDSLSGRIFQKKGYYSKEREKEIIVDISIEVWLPNAKNYSLLWVCECKNYNHSIPVDDIEEFKAKLDQIAGKNVKGVVATKNSFQSSARKYATNQGIGLVRIMPDEQVNWIMHSMTTTMLFENKLNSQEFKAALTTEDYLAQNRNFYSVFDGYIFGNWQSLLQHTLTPNN